MKFDFIHKNAGRNYVGPFWVYLEWSNNELISKHGYLRRYIGQEDKTGKEIFEGDIVKSTFGRLGVIEFDKGLFGINWDYGTHEETMRGSWGTETNLRNLHDGFNRKIEVIGNIYEHSKILNLVQ